MFKTLLRLISFKTYSAFYFNAIITKNYYKFYYKVSFNYFSNNIYNSIVVIVGYYFKVLIVY